MQVNVPPAKAQKTELYFITCDYAPDEKRSTGWMPPAAVQQQNATAKADANPATYTDLPYGPHFRQTMDVWLAKSDKASAPGFLSSTAAAGQPRTKRISTNTSTCALFSIREFPLPR